MAAKVAILLVAGLLSAGVFCEISQSQKTHEQSAFGAEDVKLQNPIPLPDGVKQLLRKDPYVADSLKGEDSRTEYLPDSWFMASDVHLAGPDEKDVVVVGQCPIRGANFAPFWIFRPKGSGYEKIFFTGALGIEIKQHRTNGYRDIESGIVTMQTPQESVWRFDSEKYQRGQGTQTK